ncbi:MAG: hypothetical protein QOE58_1242 [Actinomycetota bacterium]|jgi:hypothetical protein|nr:hypothetical protein [Actinomycetota bacterium]
MKRNAARGLSAILLVILAGALTSIPARGETPCGGLGTVNCYAGSDGIQTGLSEQTLARAKKGLDQKAGATNKPKFEFTSEPACPSNHPDSANSGTMCVGATNGCVGNTPQQGLGPKFRLYHRELDTNGKPVSGWQMTGTTCFPQLVARSPA